MAPDEVTKIETKKGNPLQKLKVVAAAWKLFTANLQERRLCWPGGVVFEGGCEDRGGTAFNEGRANE